MPAVSMRTTGTPSKTTSVSTGSSVVAGDCSQSFADVDENHDDLGLFDRDLGLGLDRLTRLALLGVLAARTPEAQARGVDDRELASAPVGDAVEAVASQA